jgi:hypothetical protein
LCADCLLEEERDWLDGFCSTIEGRFAGDGEPDGILEDRQASACSGDELVDLETKREKVADRIAEVDQTAAEGWRAASLDGNFQSHDL